MSRTGAAEQSQTRRARCLPPPREREAAVRVSPSRGRKAWPTARRDGGAADETPVEADQQTLKVLRLRFGPDDTLELTARAALPGEASASESEDECLSFDDEPADADAPCNVCGERQFEPGENEMLLCNGEGCDRAYHMWCLKPPLGRYVLTWNEHAHLPEGWLGCLDARAFCVGLLADALGVPARTAPVDLPLCVARSVPSGDWLCPKCATPVWSAEMEHSMDLSKGAKLWARDKKGYWAVAMPLSTSDDGLTVSPPPLPQTAPASELRRARTPCAYSGHTPCRRFCALKSAPHPSLGQTYIRFKGFHQRFNEHIPIGEGRLRPLELGTPKAVAADDPNADGGEDAYFLVEKVSAMRTRYGRKQYLTHWL
eukprot:19674-Prymnesium_polylepis.1